jgi:Flp pilus assembly protein TadD
MRRVHAFLFTLVMSATVLSVSGCEGCQNQIYKSAIEKALHEDALTGKQPTYDHTAAMRKVDMTNCPEDFRVTYMRHIHAWDEASAVREAKQKLDNEQDAAAIAGTLASLFGSDETPWGDHIRAEQEVQRLAEIASRDISSTWQDVEEVASKYGAEVPQ